MRTACMQEEPQVQEWVKATVGPGAGSAVEVWAR
jgi:hypothetical protein